MTDDNDEYELDADVEARIDDLDLDPEDVAAFRRSVGIREKHQLEPEFTVEVPEEVAAYVCEAAQRNDETAGESEYIDRGLTYEERVENLLLDFVNIRPRWVFPDGTVIERGEVIDRGD